jgi:hypothetical protein
VNNIFLVFDICYLDFVSPNHLQNKMTISFSFPVFRYMSQTWSIIQPDKEIKTFLTANKKNHCKLEYYTLNRTNLFTQVVADDNKIAVRTSGQSWRQFENCS